MFAPNGYPLSIEIEISIWEIAMTINPEQKTEFKRVWIKTAAYQRHPGPPYQ